MGKTLHLRYGLADNARADAKVHFKVLAEGALLLEEEVSGRGLLEKDLDTSALAGRSARLVLSVSAADTNLCIFAVNGSPR
jgi:hypothetical protein